MSSFNDAYARKPESQLRGYVSSWIDSGPNQLSLLSRLCRVSRASTGPSLRMASAADVG